MTVLLGYTNQLVRHAQAVAVVRNQAERTAGYPFNPKSQPGVVPGWLTPAIHRYDDTQHHRTDEYQVSS